MGVSWSSSTKLDDDDLLHEPQGVSSLLRDARKALNGLKVIGRRWDLRSKPMQSARKRVADCRTEDARWNRCSGGGPRSWTGFGLGDNGHLFDERGVEGDAEFAGKWQSFTGKDDMVMYGSSYPHWQLHDLFMLQAFSAEQRAKLCWRDAAHLYGIGVAAGVGAS